MTRIQLPSYVSINQKTVSTIWNFIYKCKEMILKMTSFVGFLSAYKTKYYKSWGEMAFVRGTVKSIYDFIKNKGHMPFRKMLLMFLLSFNTRATLQMAIDNSHVVLLHT